MTHFKPSPLQMEALNAYIKTFIDICCIEGFCDEPGFEKYDVVNDPNKLAHDYKAHLLAQPDAREFVEGYTKQFIQDNSDLLTNELAHCSVSKGVRGENKFNVIFPRESLSSVTVEPKSNLKRRTAIVAELMQAQFPDGVKIETVQDDRFIVTAGRNAQLTDLLKKEAARSAQTTQSK